MSEDASGGDTAGETFDPDPGFVDRSASAAGAGGREDGDSTARIRAALAEVRRQVRYVALLSAITEAALFALLTNLLVGLAQPSWRTNGLPLPGVVTETLASVSPFGGAVPTTLPITSLVAVGVGLVAFAGTYFFRLRRPLIEQFEAANPPVREALRTARDAVDDDADTRMARRLYDDVVETLGSTSTLELVETRRLALTLLLVVVVSVASVQVAIVNPDLAGLLGVGDSPSIDRPDDDGLQDGDAILGDAEDVDAGDDLENISVPGTGDGDTDGPTGPGGGFGNGGGEGTFDSQQSGYAGQERLEDADLVREYNLRIREFDDAGTNADDTDTTNDAS